MTLDALVMLSGALVAFLSVAGFPPSIYKPLFFIIGVFVIALGIVVRRRRGEWETAQRRLEALTPSDASAGHSMPSLESHEAPDPHKVV